MVEFKNSESSKTAVKNITLTEESARRQEDDREGIVIFHWFGRLGGRSLAWKRATIEANIAALREAFPKSKIRRNFMPQA